MYSLLHVLHCTCVCTHLHIIAPLYVLVALNIGLKQIELHNIRQTLKKIGQLLIETLRRKVYSWKHNQNHSLYSSSFLERLQERLKKTRKRTKETQYMTPFHTLLLHLSGSAHIYGTRRLKKQQ